ncbi:hypothetical protein GUJ93_ZPchr0002g24197 [Zizania palustris]|uniref:Uncharacterized protein n=1 Tax=Zizania palustris TaxID=103762 RepID=A0A8J5VF98_ZIZPA|nr:hypothetical protein GUJ93_ZPchr0002g24197 [Zizania palustris]
MATSASLMPSKSPPFPQPPAPPLLPLPVHLQAAWPWPASRPVQRAKKPTDHAAAPSLEKTAPAQGASVPIPVAPPAKKRVTGSEQEVAVGWTTTDSLYSVSPAPSSVPMPTFLLATAAGRKAPTACAVEVATAAAAGGVDVGATDELRRLLRL